MTTDGFPKWIIEGGRQLGMTDDEMLASLHRWMDAVVDEVILADREPEFGGINPEGTDG